MGVFSIFILWPMFIFMIGLSIVLPILGVALNVAAIIMLALNILFFLLLVLLRKNWKRAGKMEKLYIDSFSGLRRFSLQAVKLMFTFGMVWEILVILGCIAFLIFQPVTSLMERLSI